MQDGIIDFSIQYISKSRSISILTLTKQIRPVVMKYVSLNEEIYQFQKHLTFSDSQDSNKREEIVKASIE